MMSRSDDRQRRDHHVEAVDREAAVPVHLQPLSCQCGSRWSRRYAGAHTWAPMSPPVGVLFRRDQVARAERLEVDDVHHHVRRHPQGGGGDHEAHDPRRGPRAAGPRDRAAPGPARRAGDRYGSRGVVVDGRSVVIGSGAAIGLSGGRRGRRLRLRRRQQHGRRPAALRCRWLPTAEDVGPPRVVVGPCSAALFRSAVHRVTVSQSTERAPQHRGTTNGGTE